MPSTDKIANRNRSQAQMAAALRRKGDQHKRLLTEVQDTLHDLAELITEANDAGVSIAAIARSARLSRPHVYRLLGQ